MIKKIKWVKNHIDASPKENDIINDIKMSDRILTTSSRRTYFTIGTTTAAKK